MTKRQNSPSSNGNVDESLEQRVARLEVLLAERPTQADASEQGEMQSEPQKRQSLRAAKRFGRHNLVSRSALLKGAAAGVAGLAAAELAGTRGATPAAAVSNDTSFNAGGGAGTAFEVVLSNVWAGNSNYDYGLKAVEGGGGQATSVPPNIAGVLAAGGQVGVNGSGPTGVQGSGTNVGVEAIGGGTGLSAVGDTYGVSASTTNGDQKSVYATSTSGTGVYGLSSSGRGIWGDSFGDAGVFGWSAQHAGVQGMCNHSPGVGVYGTSDPGWAVFGDSKTGSGVRGHSASGYGVEGFSDSLIGGSFVGGSAPIYLQPHGSSGPPTSGGHYQGEIVLDNTSTPYVCTSGDGTVLGTWQAIGNLRSFPDPRRVYGNGSVAAGSTVGPIDATTRKNGTPSGVPAGARAAYCAVQSYQSGVMTLFPDGAADPGIANWSVSGTGGLNMLYLLVPLSSAGQFKIHTYFTGSIYVDVWGYLL